MILGTYPPTLYEAVALQMFLADLGYSIKDEIFLIFALGNTSVVLRAEDRIIEFKIGICEFAPERMDELWNALASEWNAGGCLTNEEKENILNMSKTRGNQGLILLHLLSVHIEGWIKRFTPPFESIPSQVQS